MGNIYIFRGKAATGKSTLSDMLAKKLSIPVIRKDDIVDALKSSVNIEKTCINNEVCYNILYKIIKTNLSLGADFILDIALGDRTNATHFFKRLDFQNNTVIKFFLTCTDENEWKKRHLLRLQNPLLHQSFRSYDHVVDYYSKQDINPFEDEHIIDSAKSIQQCFYEVVSLIGKSK